MAFSTKLEDREGVSLTCLQIYQFSPVDTPGAIDAFLCYWKPSAIMLMESELWPNLIIGAAKNQVGRHLFWLLMNWEMPVIVTFSILTKGLYFLLRILCEFHLIFHENTISCNHCYRPDTLFCGLASILFFFRFNSHCIHLYVTVLGLFLCLCSFIMLLRLHLHCLMLEYLQNLMTVGLSHLLILWHY